MKRVEYSACLDGFRALSNLLIMGLHTHSTLKAFLDRESWMLMVKDKNFAPFFTGLTNVVDTFFVLSGYLIVLGLLRGNTREYYWNRFIRIYPLLLLVSILDLIFPVKGLDHPSGYF